MEQGSELADYLDKALTAFSRARGLTQQLLTFAKGGRPAKKVVDLRRLVEEGVRFALAGSSTRPVLELSADLWLVEVDPGQMAQVVDNLTINARDAMPAGGTLTVRACNVAPDEPLPSSLRPQRYVRLEFRDRGVGIPPENVARVFEPFFTTKAQGSGLGLATSYSIVKRHGGLIEVESQPGAGASFSVYLPAAAVGAAVAPARLPLEHGSAAISNGRVLVLDDEELVREAISAGLARLGYEATCVETGADAVRAFEEAASAGAPFRAAILDLTVPGGMGGRQTAAVLGARQPGFPMIVTSGYSEDPAMSEPRSHGFVGCMPKPFHLDDLREAIEGALRDHR